MYDNDGRLIIKINYDGTNEVFTLVDYDVRGDVTILRNQFGEYCHGDVHFDPLYKERYKIIEVFRSYDTAIVVDFDGYKFHINKQGERLYPERYVLVGKFRIYDNTWVKNDMGEYFHIDREGKPLYDNRFDEVKPFRNKLYTKAKINSTWVTINRSGEITKEEKL